MLQAVEETAREAVATVKAIHTALLEVKHLVRKNHRKFYSQDLINSLFMHPYTKVQFMEEELGVSRVTAMKYLNQLADGGILEKARVGRTNLYMNIRLVSILAGVA